LTDYSNVMRDFIYFFELTSSPITETNFPDSSIGNNANSVDRAKTKNKFVVGCWMKTVLITGKVRCTYIQVFSPVKPVPAAKTE
jgi:hypothetical protein